LGVMGGIWVGFSGSMAIGAAGGWDPSIIKLVPAIPKFAISLTFPIALLLILVIGGELFTGNVMIMTLGLLAKQITWLDYGKSLGFAFIGNYIGAVLMAGAYHGAASLDHEPWHSWLAAYTYNKIYASWDENLIRAILCNFIVCASVAVCTAAEDISGKLLSIYAIISIFVIGGFEHCVANMFFLTTGIIQGDPTGNYTSNYGDFIWRNLIPVAIGNYLGVALVLSPLLWFNFYLPSPVKLPTLEEQKKAKKDHKHDVEEHNENEVIVHMENIQATDSDEESSEESRRGDSDRTQRKKKQRNQRDNSDDSDGENGQHKPKHKKPRKSRRGDSDRTQRKKKQRNRRDNSDDSDGENGQHKTKKRPSSRRKDKDHSEDKPKDGESNSNQ